MARQNEDGTGKIDRPGSISRRNLLAGTAAAIAAPMIFTCPARADTQIFIKNAGGAYDDVMRKAVYDPFTKATGITVVPVGTSSGALLAMVRAKKVEVDVIDIATGPLLTLERMGVLAPVAYDKWQWGEKDDLIPDLRTDYRTPNYYFAQVMVFNAKTYASAARPRNWPEFWDLNKFPGPRMSPDLAFNQPDFEFALMADGVAKDKLYPIDIDRALRSLSRLRPAVRKFYETGALSSQMITDGEVVLGTMTSGRAQTVIDSGAPLGIDWTDHLLFSQSYGIFKDAQNVDGAQKFLDFAAQPEIQVAYAKALKYGPTSIKARSLISPEIAKEMPGSEATRPMAIVQDPIWWEDNRKRVADAWNNWLLQ